MKAVLTITRRGTVTLPAKLREHLGIKVGDQFEVERIDRGEYLLRRKTASRNEGLVNLLLACPAKGWFKPLDRAESTEDIPVANTC